MIYLDNNSTTRVLESVAAAMQPFLTDCFANPSSAIAQFSGLSQLGMTEKAKLSRALGGETAEQFVITSGATESNNLALLGAARANPARRHVVISAIEHPSVMEVADALRSDGYRIDVLPVSPSGVIQESHLSRLLCRDTLLVSVMLANNETGVIQPLKTLADAVKKYDPQILVHTDATQAVGKIAVDLSADLADVDLLSLSAHKFHGPKGIGALFVRDAGSIAPIFYGGGQQNGLRPGTENPAALVGMTAALSTVLASSMEVLEMARLRDDFESRILALYPDAYVLGASVARLPTTSNVCLPSVEAEDFVDRFAARGIAISAGSACSYGARKPSYVAMAHGIAYEQAKSCVRLSLSIESTQQEVDLCLKAFGEELGFQEMLLNNPRERLLNMSRYGQVPVANPLLAEFLAEKAGTYPFKLYPQLWGSADLAAYYKGLKWTIVPFTDPPPPLPDESGIYMFVVGPYCGGLQDHSYIFYVGKATSIKRRYPRYLLEKAGKGTNPRKNVMLFLNGFEDHLQFHYTLIPKDQIAHAEALLKDNLTPPGNVQLEIIGRLTK